MLALRVAYASVTLSSLWAAGPSSDPPCDKTSLPCRGSHVFAQRRSLATCTSITLPYPKLQPNLATIRKLLGKRPLTLAEKILYSHVYEPEHTLASDGIKRGETCSLVQGELRCRMHQPRWHCEFFSLLACTRQLTVVKGSSL